MSTFQAKYSDQQRDAVALAYVDGGIRPAKRVAELAGAGQLAGLEPFQITDEMVRWYARKLRQKRAGKITSQLAQQPPRDALEALRRRWVNLADALLADAEKAQRRGELEPKRLADIARCLRELAAIPGPNDARPVKPGDKIPGGGGALNGSRTKTGPAAAMLAELDKERRHPARHVETAAAPEHAPNNERSTENNAAPDPERAAAQHAPVETHGDETTGPDSWTRVQVAGLARQRAAG